MWKLLMPTIALAIGLGLQACAPKPNAEEPCNFVQNVYGERISWKTSAPIKLSLHSAFPEKFVPALQQAVYEWELATGRRLFEILPTRISGPIQPRQDGVSVIYWMTSWEADRSTEQGRTSIYWVGDQITEADMRINDKDFNYFIESPQSNRDVHLASLLVHELGHVLGLKHNDGEESVMATYLRSNTVREAVALADSSALRCEYL